MAQFVQDGISVSEASSGPRGQRRPQHIAYTKTEAWCIQPFMIAPVLPGETLRSLLVQSRVVTDPVKNPLIGWWHEKYFFYVKHRDMSQSAAFQSMVLTQGTSMSSQQISSTDDARYEWVEQNTTGIKWVTYCLEAVTNEYFRDEGEAYTDYTHTATGLPMASIMRQSFTDSMSQDADFTTGADLDVDLDANATITASEVEKAMLQYEHLKQHNMTEMSYEQFLRAYGVRQQLAQRNKPELIRYVRDFQYPSNTINASNGAPSSAVSWSIAERADKDRYFSEPGFIFGVEVNRPKVYLRQYGAASAWLNDAFTWLPSMLHGSSQIGWKKFNGKTTNTPNNADGPFRENTDDYWLDMKDLFMYGDQFVTDTPSEATVDGEGIVSLPLAAGNQRYPAQADSRNMFVDDTTSDFLIRSDSVVSLNVSSHIRDTSPRANTT